MSINTNYKDSASQVYSNQSNSPVKGAKEVSEVAQVTLETLNLSNALRTANEFDKYKGKIDYCLELGKISEASLCIAFKYAYKSNNLLPENARQRIAQEGEKILGGFEGRLEHEKIVACPILHLNRREALRSQIALMQFHVAKYGDLVMYVHMRRLQKALNRMDSFAEIQVERRNQLQ